MERLTNKKLKIACDYFVNFASKEEAVKYRILPESAPKYEEIYRKLADYEDKQEQGLIWDTPVAIGETVYRINEFAENPIIPMAVVSFEFKGITDTFKEIRCKELGLGGEWTYRFTDIGKTVFLTRPDADKALAQIKGE